MNTAPIPEPPAARRRNRTIYVVAYIMLGAVSVREVAGRVGTPTLLPCALLLAGLALMTASDPALFRRWRSYPYVYFPAATLLIEALGWLPPYQDIWGLLYVLIGVQAGLYLSRRVALAWAGVSIALAFGTFILTFGAIAGAGHALTYLAGTVLVVSWEALSAQARAAREASQALLRELQDAHARLQAYADDIEEQAAQMERDRMAHQLHDSVSQTLFSINLGAESARMLLEKNPERLPAQLERLEELTAGALRQMRSLITEWRPR
jgi:signal transduction histidine kinase